MPHCNESADPAKHVGPFKSLYLVDSGVHLLQAEECLACGFTVVRKLEPGSERKERKLKRKVRGVRMK